MSLSSRRLSLTDRDYAAEHDQLDQLFDLTADGAAQPVSACAECGQPFLVTALFWTPTGNRCRPCYQATYGRTR